MAEEVAKQLGWKFINAGVLASVASIGRSVTDVFGAGSEDKVNYSHINKRASNTNQL